MYANQHTCTNTSTHPHKQCGDYDAGNTTDTITGATTTTAQPRVTILSPPPRNSHTTLNMQQFHEMDTTQPNTDSEKFTTVQLSSINDEDFSAAESDQSVVIDSILYYDPPYPSNDQLTKVTMPSLLSSSLLPSSTSTSSLPSPSLSSALPSLLSSSTSASSPSISVSSSL